MHEPTLLERIRNWFSEDCAMWWRYWSNRLALLFAAAAAWIVENPTLALQYVEDIPQPWRSILTFAVMAGVPILVRMSRQERLEK